MSTPRTHVSLDGTWTLALDPKRIGIEDRWFKKLPSGQKEIELPTMQSQQLATQGGVGWFFKTFETDVAWKGSFVSLQLGSTRFPSRIWLNGTQLGDHVGGGTPASFPVSAQLNPGQNLLAIRLELFEQDEEVVGDLPIYYPGDVPADVGLAVMPKAHIEQVYLQPDIRRKRVKVQVEAPSDSTVHVLIEGTDCRVEGEPGELTLPFPEFECWSAATPQRYVLRVDLINSDNVVDSVSLPFGMREFTVKDERFYLNNRPLFVKCASYVPQYPTTLKADKLNVLIKRELTLLKGAGFNALRVCKAPAPESLLEMADTMGLLVFAEAGDADNFGSTPEWERAVESQVLRDRNRASVVAWCGIHVVHPNAKPSQNLPASCAADIRALDPSRLLLCDAPPRRGIKNFSSTLVRPYRDEAEAYESYDTSIIPPVGQLAKDYLRFSGDPDRLNFQARLSVGGTAGWVDGSAGGKAQQQQFEETFLARKMERCFGSVENFIAAAQKMQDTALKTQIDAVRSNVKMMGYGVEYLCDGPATAPFGLADVKRQPKAVLTALKQVQQEVRPVIQMYKTNLVPREEVGVTIMLVNEARIEGRGELSLQVVGPTNQVLWKKKRQVKIPRHGREIWSGEIAASGSPGPHRFVVRLILDRKVVGENSVDLHVVQPLKAEPVEVNVLGEESKWHKAVSRFAKLHNFLAPIHIIPPLTNSIRAYPANDLFQILAQVNEGAVAIVFSPPEDWNDITEYVGSSLKIASQRIDQGQRINHHYAKLHPVFDGLPSRDLMRQPYQNLLSMWAFENDSDEEMTGVHSVYREANGPLRHWWGNNITVKRLGAGRVVFTHLRVLEHLGTDPVADRFFVNLLQHFSRRSIPSTELIGADQRAVGWMAHERNTGCRKWMVLGTFPNWNGRSGHDTVFPPETTIDFDATYPGWYRALRWKNWNTRDLNRHTLDFTAALDGDVGTGEPTPYGTAYAYAEFSCDRRQEVALNLEGGHATKVWMNGMRIHETDLEEEGRGDYETLVSWVKQGKNTLLVKCSKGPGPFTLAVDIDPTGTAPLLLNWWK